MACGSIQRGGSLLVLLALLGGGSHGVESSSRAARAVGSDDVALAILELVSRGRHPLTSEPLATADRVALTALYAGGSYAPLWSDAGGRPTQGAQEATDALLAAAAEGLDPQDYHASALQAAMAHLPEARWAGEIAALDAAVSLGTLQYLRHLHQGRVDPRALGFHISVPADVHDFPADLRRAVHENRVGRTMADMAPPWALYRSLRSMLARYRPLMSEPPLALAPQTVRTGDRFREAAPLLARLRALGDVPLTSALAGDGVYDAVLTEGVRRFQARHGLEPDGILGASTRAALSLPLARRVRQIELALERLRWLPHLGPDRVVAVNIPMFQLWAWNTATPGSLPVLHMNAIVGRALATETPVFADEMTDITFRPYWNVPSSIVGGEIVPAMRRNPDYLEQHAMEVVSTAPLRVRQRPGPRNALGLIKFEFPNDLSVYMHDTPAPELFSRSRRDFSHGCVRVEDPIGLAEWALDGQDGWTSDRIVGAMHGTESQTVKLARPIQVILFYVTAVVTPEDGLLHFAADIYRHDERLDRALTTRQRHETDQARLKRVRHWWFRRGREHRRRCADNPTAVPCTSWVTASTRGVMRHHFVDVSLIHDAIIRADLEAVREPARRLGDLPVPARLPDAGIPYVVMMRRAGQRAATAKTLDVAATETVTMLAQCAGCHQTVGVRPAPASRSAPDVGGLVGHMLEHQRAADELLQGLVIPSSSEWQSGATRLRAAPLRPVWLIPELRYVPDLDRVDAAVHDLADAAILADSPARRNAVYARLITTCAECHGVHRRIFGPDRRGR